MSKSNEVEALLYKTNDPTLIARTYFFYLHSDAAVPQEKAGSVEQYSFILQSTKLRNMAVW